MKKIDFFKINNRLLEVDPSDNSESESESESGYDGNEIIERDMTDTTTTYNNSNSTIPVQSSSSGLST